MAQITKNFNPRLARRKTVGGVYYAVFLAAVTVSIFSLFVLLIQTAIAGLPWLDFDFLTNYMSRKPELAGIKAAVMGTIITIVFTALFTVPVGVGAAIYLEEYAPKNRLTQIIEINISNLAGVPSVVYGLLGLGVFVQLMSLARSSWRARSLSACSFCPSSFSPQGKRLGRSRTSTGWEPLPWEPTSGRSSKALSYHRRSREY